MVRESRNLPKEPRTSQGQHGDKSHCQRFFTGLIKMGKLCQFALFRASTVNVVTSKQFRADDKFQGRIDVLG